MKYFICEMCGRIDKSIVLKKKKCICVSRAKMIRVSKKQYLKALNWK